MCRTTFMPSGIRLQQLIQNQYKEILAREKNNDKFIHLYDIGAYWVAFECSACRLSGLFSESELTLFRVPDCVEYVVMVSVPADEAEGAPFAVSVCQSRTPAPGRTDGKQKRPASCRPFCASRWA